MLSFVTTALAALAVAAPLIHPVALQDDPPTYPDEYVPYSVAPLITVQASAPITVTVKYWKSDGSVVADPFPHTITAKDMDTKKNYSNNQTLEVVDSVLCSTVLERYPTSNGPVFRGIAADNLNTWDLVAYGGVVVDPGPIYDVEPQRVYINDYRVYNPPHNDVKQDDNPVDIHQTIIRALVSHPQKRPARADSSALRHTFQDNTADTSAVVLVLTSGGAAILRLKELRRL